MSNNLKVQNFKIIIAQKFCQKIKVCYFCLVICESHLKDISSRFLCIVNARPSNLWCFEYTNVFFTSVWLQTHPRNFSEVKFKIKNQFFGLWKNTYHTIFIYGKMLIIEISYNFLYVWNCMRLFSSSPPPFKFNTEKSI